MNSLVQILKCISVSATLQIEICLGTRNRVAIDLGGTTRPTVTGLYFFNLHDGVRFNSAEDWRLE